VIDEDQLEPLTKEMAAPVMPAVGVLCVFAAQKLHERRDIGARRADDEVVVRPHSTFDQHVDTVTFGCFGENLDEAATVVSVLEDQLLAIAAIHRMVNSVGHIEAWASWHNGPVHPTLMPLRFSRNARI
jgi:hypothetical protein